ncbi:MAG: hypothetical protein HY823_08640 [Acidobacteria bacterium]|nr:hypothetical protein [Acidobacteriota bacterium]
MRIHSIAAAGLLALSTTLGAQDADHAQAKAGLLLTSMGQLKGITGKNTAPNYELGYYFANAGDLGLDLMPYAGYLLIEGKTDIRYVPAAPSVPQGAPIASQFYKVSAFRFGVDMVWAKGKLFNQAWAFRTGPVFHNYIAEGKRTPNSLTNKRWQIGWRAGVDVAITSKFFLALDLSAGEWRGGAPGEPRLEDVNPNNPAYGAFMVGYRF